MAVTPSGKDKLTKHMRLYANTSNLSGASRTYSELRNSFEDRDVTAWSNGVTDTDAGRRSVGLMGYQALLDDSTNAYSVLKAKSARLLSLLFGGGGEPATGDPAYMLEGTNMQLLSPLDDGVALLSTNWVLDNTQYSANALNPWGVVLYHATSSTSTTLTGDSVDLGAASSNGWHAHLHLISTSSPNYAFTIEHSTDDSAWSTLGTFTTTGGTLIEQLTGAGSVNRYVRFVATRTAGSILPVCTFAVN